MQQTRDSNANKGSDCLTIREAYLAMYYFVNAYWERGRRADGSVTLLCHALGPIHDPSNEDAVLTADPAFWSDWLAAVETARLRGVPSSL